MTALDHVVVWLSAAVSVLGVTALLAVGSFGVLSFLAGAVLVIPAAMGAYLLGHRHGDRERVAEVREQLAEVTATVKRMSGGRRAPG